MTTRKPPEPTPLPRVPALVRRSAALFAAASVAGCGPHYVPQPPQIYEPPQAPPQAYEAPPPQAYEEPPPQAYQQEPPPQPQFATPPPQVFQQEPPPQPPQLPPQPPQPWHGPPPQPPQGWHNQPPQIAPQIPR